MSFCNSAQYFKIQYIHTRVRWRFRIVDLSFGSHQSVYTFQVIDLKITGGYIPFGKKLGKQTMCGPKNIFCGNDMVPALQKCRKSREYRCHPGGKRKSTLGPLHFTDLIY